MRQQSVVLLQVAAGGQKNEIVASSILLSQLDLTSILIRGDAMFTQHALNIQIVEDGGDEMWIVKDNWSTLHDNIELLFEDECVNAGCSIPLIDSSTTRSVDGGQRRAEEWVLVDYSNWVFPAQVMDLEYTAVDHQTGKLTALCDGVTRTLASVLDAERLLTAVQRDWEIETGLCERRDGNSQVQAMRTYTGHTRQPAATLNNLLPSLFKRHSITDGAEAQRAIAHHPGHILHHLRTASVAQARPNQTLQPP